VRAINLAVTVIQMFQVNAILLAVEEINGWAPDRRPEPVKFRTP